MIELLPLAGHQPAQIEVRDSPLHGLGVFACVDLPKGSLIERCFYLVIDDDDLHEINRLNDYLFTSPDVKSDYLCVLGCGMIYNHGSPANAEWQIADVDNRFIEFTALADIRAGDEILHDYGEEYWASRA
ncbi:MAG: SET domain-containing protein [Alphaproteobacteria bacterium]|nr:SET domain-containing protein [Alphaproteobacteria bacterium]